MHAKVNSFGTLGGCEMHNRVDCLRCIARRRIRAFNRRTAKLRPTGAAASDKLVRERLRANREER